MAGKQDKDNVIPAGSKPNPESSVFTKPDPESGGSGSGKEGEAGTQGKGAEGGEKTAGQEGKTGQDTGAEDLKALKEGFQGLQNQINQFQQSFQQSAQAGDKGKAAETPDYQAQLDEIQKQIDDGEIGVSEALAKTAQVSRQMAEQGFEQRLQKYDEERQADAMFNKFMTDHPDFQELDQQGVLDQIIQKDPMQDKFSAYWWHRTHQAEQSLEQAKKEAYEQGREEGQKIATADEGQRKVLNQPGASARQAHSQETTRKPANEAELVQMQMQNLAKRRQAAQQ